jgi:membrane fusion protein, multidrug efflux system
VKKNFNRPVTYIAVGILLLLVAGFYIVPKIFSSKEDKTKITTTQTTQTTSVEGFIIIESVLENEVKTNGTVRANEEVEIRSEVSRKVTGIYFREGTYVRSGQTLFRLDASDLNASLNKLELDENLSVLKTERLKTLLEKGLTSQEEFDIQENELEKIRADIALTRISISKTYVRAPFSGIIGLRNVSRGAYVSPNLVLANLQDVSRVKIDFSIPEKYASVFRRGQKITFKVDGVSGEFQAEVYAFEPKIENTTRSFVLRAITSNPKNVLTPGIFANVSLKIGENSKAIMIPTQALVPQIKGQSVFVVKNGKAKQVDVDIGERTEESVQIISANIVPGDTLITTNILRIKDGSAVKVTKSQ